MKIVFLDAQTIGKAMEEELRSLGEYVAYPYTDEKEALERVGDCEVLVVNKTRVDEKVMAAAPKLKLICEAATGVNNIDLKAAEKRGIIVRNVSGYSTESVVQTTFTHILALVGRIFYFDDYVKSGKYSAGTSFTDVSNPYMELAGKTLGIIGMGAIGQRVARVAEVFGMKVVYYSTSGSNHCKDYPSLTLNELLSVSDVVSIHAPLNEKTQGLIGAFELRLMKPTAILLNLGRGAIVDEASLARAVDEGIIAGAGVDVYNKEPLPLDHPFLNMKHPERLTLTPHTAWASAEAIARLVKEVAKNIQQGW